jgi:hypothetical protein
MLYIHLKACLWYFICDYSKIWTSEIDFVYFYANNTDMEFRLYDSTKTSIS